MSRRKLFLTLGGASAVGSAVLGTDAFSSVSADRAIEVNVVGDAKALLALEPASGANGEYATLDSGGTLEVDLSTANGDGVNPDATTVVRDVFRVTNQGTQPVGVWIEHDAERVTFEVDGSPVESEDSSVIVGPGESTTVGLTVDASGASAGETLLEEMTVHASAGVENPPVDGGDDGDAPLDSGRTLSTATASPGDEVDVTVTLDLTARRDVDLYERFDAGLGDATLGSVRVDGTAVTPAFADVQDNGGIVLLNDVGPGTVAVTYTVSVSGSPGTTYAFEGQLEVGDAMQSVTTDGTDTVTVEGS